jgi:DNA-directed RNA polymerase subunit F
MPTSKESAEFIAGLDSLSAEYREIDQQLDRSLGSLYDILRRIQVRANNLERNHKLREKVFKKIGKRKNRGPTITVVTYVIKAKSKADRQKASKYSRALEYLTQIKNTEPAKISEAIKEAGGIERLARKAAKQLPKTKRSTAERSNATGEDAEVASAATEVETQGSRRENRRTRGGVKLSISSGLNEELCAVPLGGKVKLIGRRVEGEKDGVDLKITRIVAMEGPSDW